MVQNTHSMGWEPPTDGSSSSYQPTLKHQSDGSKTSACITPITDGGVSSSTQGTAEQIARRAAELVGGDREKTHGDKLHNHQTIAAFWTTYLVERFGGASVLTGWDVANMMEMLKVARRLHGAHNVDDYVDAAGYASVAGEIREREFPMCAK